MNLELKNNFVDDKLKETYLFYYNDMRDEQVLEKINDIISKCDLDVINDTVNITKTSIVLGFSYTKCHDKIIESILNRFPVASDIDEFVVSVVIKVLIATGSLDMGNLLLPTRNVIKEVASKHFRIPPEKVTDYMMESVLDASKRFEQKSYSVEASRVGSWDEYYYALSEQVARNSKCLSRKIGAVMVRDKSVISTGYNGPPRGIPRCDIRWKIDSAFIEKYGKDTIVKTEGLCPRRVIGFPSGKGLEICPAGHAERNALINAVRHGISSKDAIIYMTCGIPCAPCLVEIINAGIKEIVVTSLLIYDELSSYLLNYSSLSIRMYDFIK